VAALARWLRGQREVAAARYVGPPEAADRLRALLGERSPAAKEIDPEMLPASFEVRLRPEIEVRRARPLLALMAAVPGVANVDDLGRLTERLGAAFALVRGVGVLLGLIVAVACLYVVASTIRLGIHARREEIEIQRLVGATEVFVRAPFVLEGTIQGLAGSAIAIGGLYLLFAWVGPDVSHVLEDVIVGFTPRFLGTWQLGVGLASGAALGMAGSSLALGRYVG
jgi:cell division transport system permease protein